jgi:hypothetical protein
MKFIGGFWVCLLAAAPGMGQWVNCSGTTSPTCTTGNVGIGTASPLTALDVNVSSYKFSDSVAVKTFDINFPNGVANQKVDFYIPDTLSFAGVIDFDVTDSYFWQNAFGILSKRFYLGLNPGGGNAIYTNQSRVTDEGGGVADSYAISDLSWESATHRYKITLVHRVSTGNAPSVRISAFAQWSGAIAGGLANFLTFTASPVYTTDTSTLPRPYITYNNNVIFNGNIGIGTTAPCTTNAPVNCVLSANGAIQAKEVVVNTGWSDYVFAPGYRLMPLGEVAEYVAGNHHLPGIPSAGEVEKDGIGLGEMQAKLLAKIEELTLHVIEAEKRANELDRANMTLQQRNAAVEKRLSQLEGAR